MFTTRQHWTEEECLCLVSEVPYSLNIHNHNHWSEKWNISHFTCRCM